VRYRYRAKFRARFGDDTSIFLADWQWAPAGAKAIPYPIAFGSNHTDPEHIDVDQVGEVRQTFYPLARTFIPDFLKGDHFCGTQEQWQNGWPADTPNIEIIDNAPACCVADLDGAFDCGFTWGFLTGGACTAGVPFNLGFDEAFES